MDIGDDELDYGEEELEEQDAGPASFQPGGAISAIADDEMLPDEDYEDLYDDVNIGYFQAPIQHSRQREAEGFGGECMEEENFDGVEAGMLLGVYGDEQTPQEAVAISEKSGSDNPLPCQFSADIGKEEQVRSSPVQQVKEMLKDEIYEEQIANTISTLASGEEKDATGAPTSFNVVKTKEEFDTGDPAPQVGWEMEKADAPTRSKEHGNHVSSGSEQKILGPSSKERAGGNAAVLPDGEVLGNRSVIETSCEAIGSVNQPVSGSGARATEIGIARGRTGGTSLMLDGGKPGTGATARSTQGVSNRDSSSNGYATRHGSQAHSSEGTGSTMLFVGELHWWTTDAELEAALSEFGRVKNLKFFEERASGKSKGYCQVEFYDHAAATACKEGMNGRAFNGRACLVTFANHRSIQQLGNSQVNKAQAQLQAQQSQIPPRRGSNDAGGRGSSYQGGDGSRNYGKVGYGGRGNHGQGNNNRGGQGVSGLGRGRGNFGGKGLGNGNGSGGGGVGGVTYGQGLPGHMGGHPSGLLMPPGMMGQGYDPTYGPPMGRGGAGYGGYVMHAPAFPGIVPPFPNMAPGALPGVAPHVNPAFFGRSTAANGMGMLSTGSVDGSHPGMWGEGSLSGWGGGEEHDRRAREASYGDDVGGLDYGYNGEMVNEKGRTSGLRDKERSADGDWMERRRRDDRDIDWDRERQKERDGYRDQRERDHDREDDRERERPIRRSKARMIEDDNEEDLRSRPREEEHGKRRRLAAERGSF